MNLDLRLADESMQKVLKELLKVGFSMSGEEVNFLFENKTDFLKNCVVCLINGRIASSLYMLDTYILENGQAVSAYYLYAAATFPEFRKKGYMGSLIKFANKIAIDKGQKYSVLLPADKSLCFFYEKLGYKNFFKTRLLNLSGEEMKGLSKGGVKYNKKLSFEKMSEIRREIYCEDGDIVRDIKEIEFAVKQNSFYKGKTIFSENGYAVCKIKDGTVLIHEFAVKKEDIKNLIFNVFQEFRNAKYLFRLPHDDTYFNGFGKIIPFGMIKSLDETSLENKFKFHRSPYLGLTLD